MARVLLTGGAGFIGSQTAVDLIGRALRRVMRHHDVRRLIFSSSGSIYGEVADVPIPESRPHRPSNPYSATRSIIEHLLDDLAASDPAWRMISLRDFNPAGAHLS